MRISVLLTLLRLISAQEDYYDMTTAATSLEVQELEFEADEPGSGGFESEGCQMYFVRYEKKYLRGVKGAHHVSYNETTFDECARICCFQSKFRCRSFSYFESLKQCFVMSVTQDDDKFELADSQGYVHVQIVALPTTTPQTKELPFPTPLLPVKKSAQSTKSEASGPGLLNSHVGQQPINPSCPAICENGGKCESKQIADKISSTESYCKCADGYDGHRCENKAVSTSGFPMWLIAVIVCVAILLVICIVTCVACRAQKKKSGEYRVFGALRQWARKSRKPKKAQSVEDFFDDENIYSAPAKGSASIYDTMGSETIAHSTSTSV